MARSEAASSAARQRSVAAAWRNHQHGENIRQQRQLASASTAAAWRIRRQSAKIIMASAGDSMAMTAAYRAYRARSIKHKGSIGSSVAAAAAPRHQAAQRRAANVAARGKHAYRVYGARHFGSISLHQANSDGNKRRHNIKRRRQHTKQHGMA